MRRRRGPCATVIAPGILALADGVHPRRCRVWAGVDASSLTRHAGPRRGHRPRRHQRWRGGPGHRHRRTRERHPGKPVECGGPAASEAAYTMLSGKRVALVFDPTQSRRDRYDRLLAYVEVPGRGDFGETMLQKGRVGVHLRRAVPAPGRLPRSRAAGSHRRPRSLGSVHAAARGCPSTAPAPTSAPARLQLHLNRGPSPSRPRRRRPHLRPSCHPAPDGPPTH